MQTQPFVFTGNLQTFIVPTNVCSVIIRAQGAEGGAAGFGGVGGKGASIQGDFTVSPGDTLAILVGGAGMNGDSINGGGGGGGSFIWLGNDFSDLDLDSLLIAAGGGGGAGAGGSNNGIDASIATDGTDGNSGGSGGTNGTGGANGVGFGGTGGGGGGGILTNGGGVPPGEGGTAINDGGMGGTNLIAGGFGGGGAGSSVPAADGGGGGGGGGGFSGGGGGASGVPPGGGGGGGGSYNASSNPSNIPGVGVGNGIVEITPILNTEPPIECPSDIIVFNDPGLNGAIVHYPTPTGSNNCSPVTSICSPPSGSFFPRGTTTVTCNVIDAAGNNIMICSFNVKVIVDPCRFFGCR